LKGCFQACLLRAAAKQETNGKQEGEMSYSEIVSIVNEISRWAVLVSLVYVALQTRLSVRHMRAQIQQGTAARTITILLGWLDPAAISVWIEGNGGTATPELIKQRQFHYHCGIAMIAMEDYFTQHELGLLSHEQFARGSETFRSRMREPGLRAYWLKQREAMIKSAPSYCAFIDSLCTGATEEIR
jgi:hypothetical protein